MYEVIIWGDLVAQGLYIIKKQNKKQPTLFWFEDKFALSEIWSPCWLFNPISCSRFYFLTGVRTGLRLLFSLIKHSWDQPTLASSLCSEVLQTAFDVVSNLPPLSLADDSKMPPMGLDCLMQVRFCVVGSDQDYLQMGLHIFASLDSFYNLIKMKWNGLSESLKKLVGATYLMR